MLDTAAKSAGRRGHRRDWQPLSAEPGGGYADMAICGSWRLSCASRMQIQRECFRSPWTHCSFLRPHRGFTCPLCFMGTCNEPWLQVSGTEPPKSRRVHSSLFTGDFTVHIFTLSWVMPDPWKSASKKVSCNNRCVPSSGLTAICVPPTSQRGQGSPTQTRNPPATVSRRHLDWPPDGAAHVGTLVPRPGVAAFSLG